MTDIIRDNRSNSSTVKGGCKTTFQRSNIAEALDLLLPLFLPMTWYV